MGRALVQPFIGRAGPLASLRASADEVLSTGVGRLVVLTGDAGIGKTRLSSELAALLAGDGIHAVWSRCWDGGGGPPLGPWPDVITELARQRGVTIEPAGPDVVTGDRFQRFQLAVDQLRSACSIEPGVALLDDLHAATGDAVLLTKFIARSLHRIPLLLVATWRLDAAVEAAERLDGLIPEATVIEVAPFDEGELAAYVELCRGAAAGPAEIAALLRATGGNPLFVTEVLRQPARPGGSPTALDRLLRRRLATLRGDELRVLRAAAVLGDGATLAEVAATTGDPPGEVEGWLRARPTFVQLAGAEVRFSHGLLRDALVASIPAERRHRLHAAAAAAVLGSDIHQLVRRAGHLVEAAPRSSGDRRAAVEGCLESAIGLQRSWEFGRAAEWAERGAALAGTAPPSVRAALLLAWADAVLAGGRLADARALYEAAIEPAEQAGDDRLLARAALGFGGVWVEEQRDEMSRRRMLGLCERALARLGPDEPVLAALLGVRLAAERTYDGAPADAVRGAIDAVRRLGVPAATAEALSLYHHTLLAPVHADGRLAIADELLDAAAQCHASIYSLFGLCWRTVDLFLAGDPGAERAFLELSERSATLASRSIGYIAAVLDVMRTIRRGELGRAEQLAGEVLAIGQEVGDADAFGYYGGHLLGIRWAEGRLAELRPMIEAVIESASLRRRDRIYPALRAYALAVEGDHGGARAALDDLLTEGLASITDFSNGLATLAVLIETAAELGDGALAHEVARHLAPYAHLPVMPSLAVICLGPGERFLGLAHATCGRLDDAIAAFRRALAANRRLQNRPVEALIHADLAATLRRRGDAGDELAAAEHAETAIRLGTEVGLVARVAAWRADGAACCRPDTVPAVPGALEQQDGTWRVAINGRAATVEHVVGMQYVAELVAHPDTDIPAAELSAAVTGVAERSPTAEAPALDAAARRDYQRRLAELDRQLDLADRRGDTERGRRAAEERAALLDRLRRDSGLGGRSRRLSDESERCRTRVSKAIQRAIVRIGAADPVLGRALATRIRTGYVCRYETDPGQPIEWIVRVAA